MKIGVTMGFSHHTSPDFMAASAQLMERLGFHSLWVPEHVLFFPDYGSTYPYSDSGRIPGEPDGVLDPFSALTFIAAHTQKIRLGTGICLVPQRQPVYTAKMVADLDYLSGGRVDFGVGIGWLKEEFDALQMNFSTRAKATAEYVDVMRALWAPGLSEFSGPTVTLPSCHFNPKPVQQGQRFAGPPVFFGGESEPALRRVATQGDGWYGYNLTPAEAKERLSRLDVLLAEQGRTRQELQIVLGAAGQPVTAQTMAEYRELGIDQLLVGVFGSSLDKLEARAQGLLALSQAA